MYLYAASMQIDEALVLSPVVMDSLYLFLNNANDTTYLPLCLLVEKFSKRSLESISELARSDLLIRLATFLTLPWSNTTLAIYRSESFLCFCRLFAGKVHLPIDGAYLAQISQFVRQLHVESVCMSTFTSSFQSIAAAGGVILGSFVELAEFVLSQDPLTVDSSFCRCFSLSAPGSVNAAIQSPEMGVLLLALYGTDCGAFRTGFDIASVYRALFSSPEYKIPLFCIENLPRKWISSISIFSIASGAVSLEAASYRLRSFGHASLSQILSEGCLESVLFLVETFRDQRKRPGFKQFFSRVNELLRAATGRSLGDICSESITGLLYYVSSQLWVFERGSKKTWSDPEIFQIHSMIYLLQEDARSCAQEVVDGSACNFLDLRGCMQQTY
jgi:hypothetical protein